MPKQRQQSGQASLKVLNSEDRRWLAAAAGLAERARPISNPNPGVGAIIVKHGIVIGRGWTQAGGRPHAEAVALAEAGEAARSAAIYVTLEPCAHQSPRGPACAELVANSGLARAVIGVRDPDPRTSGKGIQILRQADIAAEVANDPACRASLAGFFARQNHSRPHITLKLAVTNDGFIGPLTGETMTVTGDLARAHVHRERARCDAILVGGGTVRADNPALNVRLEGLQTRSPHRFVLSAGTAPQGWEHLHDLQAVHSLADVQYLYVEGGGQTAQAFVQHGQVDQLMIYRAPFSIGAGIAAFGEIGPATTAILAAHWTLTGQRRLGSDILEVYEPVSASLLV